MSVQFTKPEILSDVLEDGDTFVCKDFRRYAQVLQLPDPTRVEMSDAANELVTQLINEGVIVSWQAYQALKGGYRYDEYGREYVEFPETERIPQILCKAGFVV